MATHPEARGRGLAGRLLSDADGFFRAWGIPAVTTVPAEPSLHQFFGRNGFRECFVHGEQKYQPGNSVEMPSGKVPRLDRLTAADYRGLRETRLAGIPHIALSKEAVCYQAGASALTPGGGLYALEAPHGVTVLCAEGMENGALLVKELLAAPGDLDWVLGWLSRLLPAWSGIYRTPNGEIPFGMLKWLSPERERSWDWSSTAYLGLAFD